ncbi:MAG: hypothetical protein KAX20_01165, partial [Candidatus Omnitrophica bacterium]|nr:hypothetical protein [Candidatus Omnitrophota bacterium]
INYYQDTPPPIPPPSMGRIKEGESQGSKIDWDALIKESYNFGLERMVYYGLYAVNKILGTRVPTEVLVSLKPKGFTLGERVFLFLLSKNRRSPGYSYLIHLAMNKGTIEKTKFILRTLFPPKKILAQRNYIPESKVGYLHYLRRCKQVLSRFSIAH